MAGGKLLVRLGRVLGPAIAGLANAVDLRSAALGGLNLRDEVLPGAVRALFEHLTEAELEHLTKTLLAEHRVHVEGEIDERVVEL
jgi:hypothetical protein